MFETFIRKLPEWLVRVAFWVSLTLFVLLAYQFGETENVAVKAICLGGSVVGYMVAMFISWSRRS